MVRDELRMKEVRRRSERMQMARLPGERRAGLGSWRCFDFHLRCTEEGRKMEGTSQEQRKAISDEEQYWSKNQ